MANQTCSKQSPQESGNALPLHYTVYLTSSIAAKSIMASNSQGGLTTWFHVSGAEYAWKLTAAEVPNSRALKTGDSSMLASKRCGSISTVGSRSSGGCSAPYLRRRNRVAEFHRYILDMFQRKIGDETLRGLPEEHIILSEKNSIAQNQCYCTV